MPRSEPSERSRFPKGVRLRKRREFLAVQSAGTKIHGKHFFAMVARRPEARRPGV